jgi:hypothetical protein
VYVGICLAFEWWATERYFVENERQLGIWFSGSTDRVNTEGSDLGGVT